MTPRAFVAALLFGVLVLSVSTILTHQEMRRQGASTATEVLKAVEWEGPLRYTPLDGEGAPTCPYCKNTPEEKHKRDCALKKALSQ